MFSLLKVRANLLLPHPKYRPLKAHWPKRTKPGLAPVEVGGHGADTWRLGNRECDRRISPSVSQPHWALGHTRGAAWEGREKTWHRGCQRSRIEGMKGVRLL